MKLNTILILLLFFNISMALAEENQSYSVQSEVIFSTDAQDKVIQVELFSRFPAEKTSIDELFNRSIDFDNWPQYLNDLPDQPLKIYFSQKTVPDLTREIYIHRMDYTVNPPFPFPNIKISEKTIYEKLPSPEKNVVIYQFYPDPDFKQKGFKYKKGYGKMILHSDTDPAYIEGYLYFEVIPQIDIFLGIARPHVERTLRQIFEGLYAQFLVNNFLQ